jgi:integrase
LNKLRERASARHGGSLKSTDKFSVAAELWFEHVGEMVADGRRSPGTRDAYRRKLDNHVLPALAEVRLGEITTPLIDNVFGLVWSDVDLAAGEVEIRYQVTRIKGEGLVRVGTKSAAGERVLKLPTWCLTMLEVRHAQGVRQEEPVFCDALGGFRDPNNVRRDLRRARAPLGSQARQDLGAALARARRSAKLSRKEVAQALAWPSSRVELVEAGRVRDDDDSVNALAELYRVELWDRAALLSLAEQAGQPEAGDALDWITSHSFRRTTATILDDAGQSARQIADQLGHARPSLTQDVYMGRRAKNPAAAAALEEALLNRDFEPKSEGLPDESRDRRGDQSR